ncbi:hypothetical protein Q5752_000407 [Cryptotrichosporon argae]
MPRLQILQHKSYHPYNEKNKQRVREDEAKAQAEEEAKQQRAFDAEAEARLDMLRRRAGSPSDLPSKSDHRATGAGETLIERHRRDKARREKREGKQRERDKYEFDWPSESGNRRRGDGRGAGERDERDDEDGSVSGAGPGAGRRAADKWTTDGHVNFWADMEDPSKAVIPTVDPAKLKAAQEADKLTMYLSRPERETKPWYTDRDLKRVEEKATGEDAEVRRARDQRKDARSKERHDPLTSITKLLSSTAPKPQPRRPSHGAAQEGPAPSPDPRAARLKRELSERERAAALVAAKKRGWEETPKRGGQSWADEFERRQGEAGRFYSGGARRSWEV